MAWVYLLIAGLFEVFWATCMKLSHGFTQHFYTALTIAGMLVSFGLLSHVMKTLPMGTVERCVDLDRHWRAGVCRRWHAAF